MKETNNEIIEVSISDNGDGIDPEIVPNLFKKFVSKSQKGIGLGLYISKFIIDAHDGELQAENNQDGIGTTFTFTIPAYFNDRIDKKNKMQNIKKLLY